MTEKKITFEKEGVFKFDDYATNKFKYNNQGILKTKGNIILKKNDTNNTSNLSMRFSSFKNGKFYYHNVSLYLYPEKLDGKFLIWNLKFIYNDTNNKEDVFKIIRLKDKKIEQFVKENNVTSTFDDGTTNYTESILIEEIKNLLYIKKLSLNQETSTIDIKEKQIVKGNDEDIPVSTSSRTNTHIKTWASVTKKINKPEKNKSIRDSNKTIVLNKQNYKNNDIARKNNIYIKRNNHTSFMVPVPLRNMNSQNDNYDHDNDSDTEYNEMDIYNNSSYTPSIEISQDPIYDYNEEVGNDFDYM